MVTVSRRCSAYNSHYIAYKALKQHVKEMIIQGKDPVSLFFKLDRELEKVNTFFLRRKIEIERRVRILIEHPLRDPQHNFRGDHETIQELLASVYELKDLIHKTLKFGDLNKTGFRKIMKKFDKRAHKDTMNAYLSSKVLVLPFADEHIFDEVLEQVESAIQSMENWMSQSGRLSEKPALSSDDQVKIVEAISIDEAELFKSIITHRVEGIGLGMSQLMLDDAAKKYLSFFASAACQFKAFKCLDVLIAAGYDFTTEDVDHRSLLHDLIISGGNVRVMKNTGSKLNSPIERNDTQSLASVSGGDEDASVVRYLLLKSEKFRQLIYLTDAYGRIPMHYAGLKGYRKLCEVLLEAHKKTDAELKFWQVFDSDGNSPLFYAVLNGNQAVVSSILEAEDAMSESNKWSIEELLLPIACRYGRLEIAKLLLARGANIDAVDEEGETALHMACRYGFPSCVQFLVDAKKHLGKAWVKNADTEIAEKSHGWTPLFVAAVEGHSECVRILLEYGANSNKLDNNEWNAHDHAVFRGHMDVAIILKPHLKITRTPVVTPLSSPVRESPFFAAPNDAATSLDDGADRKYGHQYLQDDFMLVVTVGSFDVRHANVPLQLIDEKYAAYPSLSVLVSATHVQGEPIMVDFPLKESPAEPILFYSKNKPLSEVCLKFDLQPTFGNKRQILGRAFVMLSSLDNYQLPKGSASFRMSASLVSEKMNIVAMVHFEVLVIRKFSHPGIKIGTKNTYWKYVETKVIGHRGSGANKPGGQGSLQLGENTVLSMVTAASLGAEYVEFDVQLTRDKVPVIYHDWILSESGLNIPVHTVSLDEFRGLGPQQKLNNKRSQNSMDKTFSLTDLDLLKIRDDWKSNSKHHGGRADISIKAPFATLEETLRNVPTRVGFNIEVKYPHALEVEQTEGLAPVDLNTFVDAILKCVFDNAKDRAIIFSSFHPEACLLLNIKQPNYPVFFLTEGGTEKCHDQRCNSLQEAIRFAKFADLLGIVSYCDPLIEAPFLISAVKENGLLLFSYGQQNNDPKKVEVQRKFGLDAVIVDKILPIVGSLQSSQ